MSAKYYAGVDWNWRLSKLWQQLQEWIEYQSRGQRNVGSGFSIDPNLREIIITLLKGMFWLILGLFVLWLLWLLWKEFSPYIYVWWNSDRVSELDKQEPIQHPPVDKLLARSQELYRQGNYREACRCLYFAMLQNLHEKKVLLHKRSRTDGEYLQILGLSVSPMHPYETLLTTHERLCYSSTEIAPENYQQCHKAYEEIYQQ